MKKNMQALDLDDLDQVSGGIQVKERNSYGVIYLDSDDERTKLINKGLWGFGWGRSHMFNFSEAETYWKIKKLIEQGDI